MRSHFWKKDFGLFEFRVENFGVIWTLVGKVVVCGHTGAGFHYSTIWANTGKLFHYSPKFRILEPSSSMTLVREVNNGTKTNIGEANLRLIFLLISILNISILNKLYVIFDGKLRFALWALLRSLINPCGWTNQMGWVSKFYVKNNLWIYFDAKLCLVILASLRLVYSPLFKCINNWSLYPQ